MDTILVVNAGSSDLRFHVYSVEGEGRLRQRLKGQMNGIGRCPRLRASRAGSGPLANRAYPTEAVPDVAAAMDIISAWLQDELHINPIAVGHRVIHGGTEHDHPVLIDHEVLARLERLTASAPFDLPRNLAPIRSILANFLAPPQVACFDTAFHRTHPAVADHYAVPRTPYAEGVRRYGLHGLAYEYIAKALPKIAPEIAMGRVIVARLGSGASMCALSGGRSVESTMGFTALDELPMGAGPSQIDQGVMLSGDMRQLEASEDPNAKFAIDRFVYRIGLNAGMLAAALQGLDAFVFAAEVGENSASLRSRVAEQLAWLGVELDAKENALQSQLISSPASRIPVYVVPSDEDIMIARHTLALLMNGNSGMPS
ncbi:acetate kinase [Bradyrhizobium sp. BWC-3-1]|uniref:acetate/propionate family kinase n=1 Tax=Bradyrhizobium sp. BWC-3-1 TaxID=3080012 RepID=UPI00293EAE9C|nr:acetate kinase [Bradyrhizobium sp. BWC-3-1]WOH61970.1 acetate kinase [Bradyrhizobium sp. BWC-3-1]